MSAGLVLVLAEAEDPTAGLVVEAVRARGAEVARVDIADFPVGLSLAAHPRQPRMPGHLLAGGRRIDLTSVRSVYRRSPAGFVYPDPMFAPEERMALMESTYGMGGRFTALDWRWIDRPEKVADAVVRPRQLPVAARAGFTVPRTIMTNVPRSVREFAAEVGNLARKTMTTGMVTKPDEPWIRRTARVRAAELDDEDIAWCLALYQEWVPKAHDVRLTAVGERCFAVAAHAARPEALIDWRARHDELRYEIREVPDDVRRGVRDYLAEFELTFGAFDFSITPDGRWWFLECNPVGQWGWIAEETGLGIADALADELVAAL